MAETMEGIPSPPGRRHRPLRLPRALLPACVLTLSALGGVGWASPVRADSAIGILPAAPGICAGTPSSSCFSPLSISATAGTTITWTNDTLEVHTATSCDPQSCGGQTSPDIFHTGDVLPGASASVRLTVPGVYHYFCTHHGYMNATINIRPSEVSAAPAAASSPLVVIPLPTDAATSAPPAPSASIQPEATTPGPPSAPAAARPPAPALPAAVNPPGPARPSSAAGATGRTTFTPATRPPSQPAHPISEMPVGASGGGPGPIQVAGGVVLLLLGLTVVASSGIGRWVIRLRRRGS